MIDVHYFPTPNAWKVSIALEELSLPYRIVGCNIARGEQFRPEFLAISPNNRMPAIVDHEPAFGGPPVSVFESGTILLYLAEKTGRLLPEDPRRRVAALEWIFWQMANQGPMCGQAGHFKNYAPEHIQYAYDRYTNEAHRLYRVLNERLAERAFVADEFSMADIICWPWVHLREHHDQSFDEFPHLERWYELLGERPSFKKGLEAGLDLIADMQDGMDEEARKNLFGQR